MYKWWRWVVCNGIKSQALKWHEVFLWKRYRRTRNKNSIRNSHKVRYMVRRRSQSNNTLYCNKLDIKHPHWRFYLFIFAVHHSENRLWSDFQSKNTIVASLYSLSLCVCVNANIRCSVIFVYWFGFLFFLFFFFFFSNCFG